LKNPKTKRFIYLEVPENEDPQSYKNEIKNKLRSDNPIAGAIINKVRVIHKDEMKNGHSKN
jgi:hypothetical protein